MKSGSLNILGPSGPHRACYGTAVPFYIELGDDCEVRVWITFGYRDKQRSNPRICVMMVRCLHSFIHSVFCLTTGPKPPPKRCLHIVRSRASSFKWEYPLLSSRSSNSFLRPLPRLLATSISRFSFPSITCFRMQFLRKMWPIQLAFRFLLSCRSAVLGTEFLNV